MSTKMQIRKKPETKEVVYWEIRHGNGVVGGSMDKFMYDSEEEAIKSATDFKNDPRAKTPSMTDSNVAYWKSQTFVVTKVEKKITKIKTI